MTGHQFWHRAERKGGSYPSSSAIAVHSLCFPASLRRHRSKAPASARKSLDWAPCKESAPPL